MAKRKTKAKGKGNAKKIIRTLNAEERQMVAKFNRFVDAWKAHVHEEIAIHKRLLQGKESFDKHLKETVGIHKKFIDKISKL